MSFPIAEVLRTRGVPFVFVTGYEDRSIVPMAYRSAPRLDKPVADERLIEVLVAAFTRQAPEQRPTGGHGIVGRACRWRAISTRR